VLERHYRVVEERARIIAPEARHWDTDLLIYVCSEPIGGMDALWPSLRRFDHGPMRDQAD
jgi:hypothetical protein